MIRSLGDRAPAAVEQLVLEAVGNVHDPIGDGRVAAAHVGRRLRRDGDDRGRRGEDPPLECAQEPPASIEERVARPEIAQLDHERRIAETTARAGSEQRRDGRAGGDDRVVAGGRHAAAQLARPAWHPGHRQRKGLGTNTEGCEGGVGQRARAGHRARAALELALRAGRSLVFVAGDPGNGGQHVHLPPVPGQVTQERAPAGRWSAVLKGRPVRDEQEPRDHGTVSADSLRGRWPRPR